MRRTEHRSSEQGRRTSRSVRATLGLVALAASLAACGGAGADRSALLPIAEPVMDRLEPAVREDLERARAEVTELARQANVADEALGAAFADLGRRYHAYELFDSALPCYANAALLLPGDFRWPYYLGQVHRSMFELKPARQALARALELRPDDVPALVALAAVDRDERRFDEASRLASRALALDPRAAGAMMLMAEMAVDRSQPEEAAGWYERLLQLQPRATRLHQPLAMVYRSLDRPAEAEAALAAVGEGTVRVSDPLMEQLRELASGARQAQSRGVGAFQRGDFEGAVAAFREAVAADPANSGARLNLGSALVRLGRLEEAVLEYRAVLEHDPDHALAHFNAGVTMARLGDDAGAVRHYGEAIRIDPEYRDAHFNLANAQRRAGNQGTAEGHYRRVIDLDPGNAAARMGEALCMIETGRFDEAIRRLDEAGRLLPASRPIAQVTARVLAACPEKKVRNGARALELARELVAARREPEALETLAMALAETGRFEEAETTQREAISMAESGAGRAELLERLRGNLESYRKREPCRDPAVG